MASQPASKITKNADRIVLIVDSEPESLLFTAMIIQRFGYHACSALGVGNALEIVNDSAPVLVITDLHLKGLNGLDLLARLRQKPETISVPVIIMTRELTPELSQQCLDAGAASCIEKPVRVNALYRAVHPLLNPRSRRRNIRIETRLSVIVNDRPLDCVEGECATNLSVNGMYLLTRKALPFDSLVRVRVLVNEEKFEVEARVAYCRPPEEGFSAMWGIGLQFLKTSPECGEIIRRFINSEVTHGMDSTL